ncbi:MAG: maleate cis-trans isomerase, partial [Mycobacterium sp.]
MPTVGLLYPGHSAEDDFPALETRVGGAVRLPVVITSVGEDAHRVDALLDLGSNTRLADGAAALAADAPDAVMWACTSG